MLSGQQESASYDFVVVLNLTWLCSCARLALKLSLQCTCTTISRNETLARGATCYTVVTLHSKSWTPLYRR